MQVDDEVKLFHNVVLEYKYKLTEYKKGTDYSCWKKVNLIRITLVAQSHKKDP